MDSFRREICSLFARIHALESELTSMSYSQSDPGAMMERSKMRRQIRNAQTQIKELLRRCVELRKSDD
jgi:hypothetical protein